MCDADDAATLRPKRYENAEQGDSMNADTPMEMPLSKLAEMEASLGFRMLTPFKLN